MDGPQHDSEQAATPVTRGGILRRMFFTLSWKWRIVVGVPALAVATVLPCLSGHDDLLYGVVSASACNA